MLSQGLKPLRLWSILILYFISVSAQINSNNQAKKPLCECVPYYLCNLNSTMNTNGEGIIDIRLGPVGTGGSPLEGRQSCKHYMEVCCKTDELSIEKPTPKPEVHPTEPGTQQPTVTAKGKGCGRRNPNGINFRIVGNSNNEAQFAEFPWMVAILREESVKNVPYNVYKCGGSLIHPRVVLTAAHCVRTAEASKLTIRAGEWDTQTTNEPLQHQDRRVETIVTHPQYHAGSLAFDHALLILIEPVKYADNVDTICLPDPQDNYDGTKCTATGWGTNEFGEKGVYQVILKSIDLPVVPRGVCEDALRTTRLGKYFKLDESLMCAGGEKGVDTCKGDGGSPLVCPIKHEPTRYVQVGIVAWGIGCGQELPGVYANVPIAREWIDQQLAHYKIDMPKTPITISEFNARIIPGRNQNVRDM